MLFFSNILDKLKSFVAFIKKYVTVKVDKEKIKEDGIELIKDKTGIDLNSKKETINANVTSENKYTPSNVSTPKTEYDSRTDIMGYIDFTKYKCIKSYGNSKAEESILIVDDLDFVYKLYQSDFNMIKREIGFDILANYSVKFATGTKSGFVAINEINNNPTINYAFLDITLGSITKNSKGDYIELDGIDVGLYLLDKNPKAKIMFVSGHTLNRMNPKMSYFYKKFEEKTGLKIDDYYLYKNSDRYLTMYNQFFKDS